ncbi:MAG TPA: hypothetical protein PKO33_01630 [Pyrinomonadaceae bacterium]|nr:hypothetical protein [Pyrinomonadaceae bacterium]
MARDDRSTEPREIRVGERIAWTRTFSEYPATEYGLEYRFRGNGTGINVTGAADGDAFDCEITAAQSATLLAGETYEWQAWLTETADATNTWIAASGTIDVKAGFSSGITTAVDLRSDAKIILDAINATILNKATSDQLEYEIATPAGSRKLKRMGLKELTDARKIFAEIVARERAAERVKRGGKFGRTVLGRLWED